MDCFEQVHDAAVDAIAELDALCERYDVSYIHYSRVFDSIIGICEAAIPKGGSDAEPGEDEAAYVREGHDTGRSCEVDGDFAVRRDEDHEEGHGHSGEHAEANLPSARMQGRGHLVIVQ